MTERPTPVAVRAPSRVPRRIPSLDGLRAIFIALVFLSHLGGTAGFPFSPHTMSGIADIGNLGVCGFFVLSGFLITGLLLEEQGRTGGIALGRFYARRALRIMPPYLALLAVVGVLTLVGRVQLAPGDFWHALTYTTNYHRPHAWWLGHTWSLAVEEQFYLLWPLALLLAGRRRGVWLVVAVLALCPLLRIGEALLLPHGLAYKATVGNSFETVADALAAGCALALLRDAFWARPWYRRLLASRWMMGVPVVILAARAIPAVGPARLAKGVYLAVGVTIIIVGVAIGIDWCVRNAAGRVGRVLNHPVLAYIGVLSYSLYLWQQLFLHRGGTAPTSRFPLNVGLAVLTAMASYYLIERPALRLRSRLVRRSER